MKLSEWISANGGRGAVARLLNVTPVAVHHWLRRQITPKITTMRKIVELSEGRVSFADIIEETKPKPAPRKAAK